MRKIIYFLAENMEAILSICALIVAYITYYSSRKHNYLSVKPIAYILPKDYEDHVCVILQNKGTGPLITKSIKFINDETKEEKKYLIDFVPALKNGEKYSNFSKANKYILTPNEDKILLEYTFRKDSKSFEENKRIIRKALKDIRIVITYTGVYNETKDTLDFKLKWYGRHFNK
jgi:exonuclease III